MPKSSLPVVRSLLIEAGYRVHLRTNGWAECFVQREAERWEGRGETEAEALDDAVGKMFPSHLARRLLAQCLEPRESEPDAGVLHAPIAAVIAAPPPPPTIAEAPAPEPIAVAEAAEPAPPEPEPTPAAPEPEAPEPAQPVVAEAAPVPAVPEPAVEPPVASTVVPIAQPEPAVAIAQPEPSVTLGPQAAPNPGPAERAPVAPPAPPEPPKPPPAPKAAPQVPLRVRTAEALESVERLMADIEGRLSHLARMCGDRQRLHMMVWICRARSIEEAHPGVREVELAVARVARRLTEIGKMFWPGSVRALQLSARPADVRREMHATWAAEPANWREATVLAERLLDEHLTKSPDLGLDEDGWADAAARNPRPTDPDALFEEVDGEIKSILIPPGEVPNGRAGDLSAAEFDQLLNAARKLRWLRAGVRDDLAWGIAMGRLRRAVPSLGDRAGRVRDVLDHRTKPSVSWAKLLGEAPPESTSAPGESPDELRAALPAASVTKDGLLAWLIKAFDVLNTPDLVSLLVPLKSEITSFSEETLNHPDRRVRRRLRELVKRVATAADEAAAAPKPAPVKPEPARDAEEAADEPAEHALATLASKVRSRTEGRRALFVSNREDPELGSRLEDLLGIDIAWCDGSLRRVQAQCERIKGGSYDLILSATGFQVHGVDSALARAAGTAGVPYVRVNRGRPVACVQAIAREFGITTGTYAKLETPKVSSAE